MILKEQFLKNKNRIFWRGSTRENWDPTKTIYGCPYVTTDLLYALNFSKPPTKPIVNNSTYLTQFVIEKPLNLFNARSKKDVKKLEDFFRTNKMNSWLKALPLLADNDWLEIFEIEERELLITILKELNYDGFVNIEGSGGRILRNYLYTLNIQTKNDLYGFNGIGIFDINNFKKVKVLRGWKDIKEEFDVKLLINSAKNEVYKFFLENENKQLNEIIDELLKNVFVWNFFTRNDLQHLYKDFDFEEMKKKVAKRKKFLEEAKRPICINYVQLFEN